MPAGPFDYIVIGSGSAGGIVAGRLSEDGRTQVLCLEAGDRGARHIWSIPPAAVGRMYDDPAVNWCYYAEPHACVGDRRIHVPRGKMLGGSSSINGMIVNRGIPLDYDSWAAQGCRGWSYQDVLPFFKKLENTDIGTDAYRGRSGPMCVTESVKLAPFYDLYIRAAQSIGLPLNHDYNGERQEGVAMAQQNIAAGIRQSTATQYLAAARRRSNASVLAGAEALSLIIEGRRCVGVRYRHKGRLCEARARREVIVSCGTANSPKLLELSGIGNPDLLGRLGIPVVHALPGVGENLRDHYAALMKWRLRRPGVSIAAKGRGWRLGLEILRYVFLRRGFISQGMGTMRVFAKSTPARNEPDIMLAAAPFIIELIPGVGRRMSRTEGFITYAHPQRTESTGSIHIRSKDPSAHPAIEFRFLQTDTDRRAAIAAVRCARAIATADPLGSLVAEELSPGSAVQSDEQILDHLRDQGLITHHMSGTCRMGIDPMAVVDAQLRVHGLDGLRIADASIMPTMTSGNTSVPCMMIGEKAAHMILEDAGQPG